MPFDPSNDRHNAHRVGTSRAARLGAMVGAVVGAVVGTVIDATNRAGGGSMQRAMRATNRQRRSCRRLVG